MQFMITIFISYLLQIVSNIIQYTPAILVALLLYRYIVDRRK